MVTRRRITIGVVLVAFVAVGIWRGSDIWWWVKLHLPWWWSASRQSEPSAPWLGEGITADEWWERVKPR